MCEWQTNSDGMRRRTTLQCGRTNLWQPFRRQMPNCEQQKGALQWRRNRMPQPRHPLFAASIELSFVSHLSQRRAYENDVRTRFVLRYGHQTMWTCAACPLRGRRSQNSRAIQPRQAERDAQCFGAEYCRVECYEGYTSGQREISDHPEANHTRFDVIVLRNMQYFLGRAIQTEINEAWN